MHVVQRKSRKKKEDKEIFLKKKKSGFSICKQYYYNYSYLMKKFDNYYDNNKGKKDPKTILQDFFGWY